MQHDGVDFKIALRMWIVVSFSFLLIRSHLCVEKKLSLEM